jgi:hypothetical protein
LSEKCSTESDISRVGRTTRDPTPTVLVAARSVSACWISTRGRSQPTRLLEAPQNPCHSPFDCHGSAFDPPWIRHGSDMDPTLDPV